MEKNNIEYFKVNSKNKTSLNEGFSFLANRIYDEIKQNELYNQYKKLKLKLKNAGRFIKFKYQICQK